MCNTRTTPTPSHPQIHGPVRSSFFNKHTPLNLLRLPLLLLHLQQQRTVDMRQHPTERDRGSDQRVQLFVAADRELQMAGRDALHLEVLGRVPCQLEDFGGEVFQDGSDVDGSWEHESGYGVLVQVLGKWRGGSWR